MSTDEIPPEIAAIDPNADLPNGIPVVVGESVIVKPAKKPLKQNRITMRFTAHHVHLTQGSHTAETIAEVLLESKRRPEEYWMADDEIIQPDTPTLVEGGRIPPGEIGLVLIENLTGRNRRQNPTAEELAAEAAMAIHVRLGDPANPHALEIPPGAFLPVRAVADCPIYLVAVGGAPTPARITVFPR